MTRDSLTLLVWIALLTGCAEDVLSRLCIDDDATFDIEEVSVLEDAMGEPGTHDAVIVTYDEDALEDGASWRVSSVDVLVMIPLSEWDRGTGPSNLTIEVFDAANPNHVSPYILSQTLEVDALSWEDVSLQSPQVALEYNHKRAWWNFDFSSVIPETGMQSSEFLVSVFWQNGSSPAVGYSRYNRPCSENWTDYGDGFGWVLNSENSFFPITENECNHPMFRVNVETRVEKDSCGPN